GPGGDAQERDQVARAADLPREQLAARIVEEQRRLAMMALEATGSDRPGRMELVAKLQRILELRDRGRDLGSGRPDDQERLSVAHGAEDEELAVVLQRLDVGQRIAHRAPGEVH